MNKYNENIEAGRCFCAFPFKYGTDCCNVYLYDHPDINEGYVDGWLVTINHIPHFIPAIEGWDNIECVVADLVGQHFGLKYKNPENKLEGFEDEDYFLEFCDTFYTAMTDAGFVPTGSDSRWEYRPKRKIAIKTARKQGAKQFNDGGHDE
jgi:hypothetical protein